MRSLGKPLPVSHALTGLQLESWARDVDIHQASEIPIYGSEKEAPVMWHPLFYCKFLNGEGDSLDLPTAVP